MSIRCRLLGHQHHRHELGHVTVRYCHRCRQISHLIIHPGQPSLDGHQLVQLGHLHDPPRSGQLGPWDQWWGL